MISCILIEEYKEVEKIYHADGKIASNMLYDMYMKLTANEMKDLAHRPQDMIKECLWNGQVNDICEAFVKDGGTKIYVPKFGVCYIINFKGTNSSGAGVKLKVHNAGVDHGLKLILDIQSRLS